MWGAGYTFHKGDTIRVELLAQDVPLERPSRSPFAITVSNFTIELPSHEPPDSGEIVKPALARASRPLRAHGPTARSLVAGSGQSS
jgi:hypothetical protein